MVTSMKGKSKTLRVLNRINRANVQSVVRPTVPDLGLIDQTAVVSIRFFDSAVDDVGPRQKAFSENAFQDREKV